MKRNSKLKNISKNKLFIFTGIFFLLFTFIGNILNNILTEIVLLCLLIIIFLNFYIYIKKYSIYLIFIIFGSLIGIFVSYQANNHILQKEVIIEPYFDYKYKITGVITDINKVKYYESEYKIKLISLSTEGFSPLNNIRGLKPSVDSNIEGLITIPSNFNIKKGNIIEFSEELRKIENFDDSFDYRHFLLSKNIYFRVDASSVANIGKIKRNFIVDKVDNVRQILLDKINNLYPKEEAIFLGGILLGARESMSDDLKTDFNNSGLTHFIAVSGFNITILIVFLSYILKLFPTIVRMVLITISIGIFVILVGDSVSVVRASIMGLAGYYIATSGRIADNLGILVFVGIIMVFISPLSLNYDVSLHLSFLAVLGILYTQNFFTKCFSFLPDFMAIREAFVLTLSALTFALPIILFNFGQLSLLSPFANIAVTWTIPLAMLGGFVSIIADFLSTGLSTIIGYFTWVLLAWDIKVVHFFGRQDWAIVHSNLGIYKYSFEVLYFVILIFLVNWFGEDNEVKNNN